MSVVTGPTPKQVENAEFAIILERVYRLNGGHVYDGSKTFGANARRKKRKVTKLTRKMNRGVNRGR